MSLLKRIGGTDGTDAPGAGAPSNGNTNNGNSNNNSASTAVTVAAPAEVTPSRSGGLSRLRAEFNPQASQAQHSKQDKVTYELKSRIQERLSADLERKKIPVTDDKQVKSITEEIF